MMPARRKKPQDSLLQMVVNFVIPIVILTKFSSQNQLGPTKAMLLALAFPVTYEIYNVWQRKKLSMLSVFAIGGILVTGVITLFGLGEGWLAVRRSITYLAVAIVLLVSVWLKRPLLGWLLPQIVDAGTLHDAVAQQGKQRELRRHIITTSYLAALLLIVVAAASYVLTRSIIDSPANTQMYNSEYARLRVLSLPYITAPFLLGMAAVAVYFLLRLEKITGLDAEKLLKKQ